MIYWACSTDQDLLEELSDPEKSNEDKKAYLQDNYGIPVALITDSCLDTLSSHKVVFAMFEGAISKRCVHGECWDKTRSDFPAVISRMYFSGGAEER
jgi:hypothetical protein